MHQVYFRTFADRVPYLIAMVRLEEGPLITTTLWLNGVEPHCDMPLIVDFDKISDSVAVPYYRPAA
jgi:hypothetical protein